MPRFSRRLAALLRTATMSRLILRAGHAVLIALVFAAASVPAAEPPAPAPGTVAAGKTASQLARDIEKVLSEYVRSPKVNIFVLTAVSALSQIKVTGQVK